MRRGEAATPRNVILSWPFAFRLSGVQGLARFGYHASHEQYSTLGAPFLRSRREQAGFTCAMSSEHFKPWSNAQGHAGHAWSWLGAALATTRLPFGIITAPCYRHHPAVLAQSAATLSEISPSGCGWPSAAANALTRRHRSALAGKGRADRAAGRVRGGDPALFEGQTVTHRGRVTVVDAKLYSRPEKAPLLIGGAVTAETARTVVAGVPTASFTVGIEPGSFAPSWPRSARAGRLRQANLPPDKGLLGIPTLTERWRRRTGNGPPTCWRAMPTGTYARRGLRDRVAFRAARGRPWLRPGIHGPSGRQAAWLAELAEVGFEEIIVHQVGRKPGRLLGGVRRPCPAAGVSVDGPPHIIPRSYEPC